MPHSNRTKKPHHKTHHKSRRKTKKLQPRPSRHSIRSVKSAMPPSWRAQSCISKLFRRFFHRTPLAIIVPKRADTLYRILQMVLSDKTIQLIDQRIARRFAMTMDWLPTPPPRPPAPWLWACCCCHSTYRLGVTRRCLHCGHRFCSGTQTEYVRGRRRGKKLKRGVACAAEFDYEAWREFGNWRRDMLIKSGRLLATGRPHNCWFDCDYPSQCRWRSIYGADPDDPRFSGRSEEAKLS